MLPLAQDVLVQGSDTWAKLGTIATLLAVVVALFGPLLLEHLRRPRLKITAASSLVSSLATASSGTGGLNRLTLNVTNHGKRQASDVRAFLSVVTPIQDPVGIEANRIEAFQSPVPFFHQEGGQWNSHFSVAIPPGFSRPLDLLVEDVTGFRFVEYESAAEAPRSLGLADGDYRVILDLVGSNFKVIRLEGSLRISNDHREPEAAWAKAPHVVRYRPEDPLLP